MPLREGLERTIAWTRENREFGSTRCIAKHAERMPQADPAVARS